MSNRQRIGLRKAERPQRAPGRIRRQALLDAAYELLCECDVEDVSFRDIADRAAVPEGSAYHFFANRFDVFSALGKVLSDEFAMAHARPVPAMHRGSWQAFAGYLVDVGVRVYKRNPPARQLLIGGKTPPEVKQADRINDRAVGDAMRASFERYFDTPADENLQLVFYYFIEITDLFLTLSMIERGEIVPGMVEKAKRAGIAFLGTYEAISTSRPTSA